MNIPTIQIRQQPAKLGIEQKWAQLNLSQPRATVEMRTEAPQLRMRQYKGDMNIDQSRAWHALGVGGHLDMLSSIYSAARGIANESIARIAREGDQLMEIHNGRNGYADIAASRRFVTYSEFQFPGPASFDNVDISYTARKPDIELIRGKVDLRAVPNSPQMDFRRGDLNIYIEQYGFVEIIPPQIDLYI